MEQLIIIIKNQYLCSLERFDQITLTDDIEQAKIFFNRGDAQAVIGTHTPDNKGQIIPRY